MLDMFIIVVKVMLSTVIVWDMIVVDLFVIPAIIELSFCITRLAFNP